MSSPYIKQVIFCAAQACFSFSHCTKTFFNFETRLGWLGWENWLTVDIFRRLNTCKAVPFAHYSDKNRKLDLLINDPEIAIEIKTTYISSNEISKWSRRGSHKISKRFRDDASKLFSETQYTNATALLLLAAVFESDADLYKYIKLTQQDLDSSFCDFRNRRWYNCSSSKGYIGLLVVTNNVVLPSGSLVAKRMVANQVMPTL